MLWDARIQKRIGDVNAPTLDVHVKAADGITVLFGPSAQASSAFFALLPASWFLMSKERCDLSKTLHPRIPPSQLQVR
jgi:hypothetical protein